MSGAAGKARRRTVIGMAAAAVVAAGLAIAAQAPPPAPKARKEVGLPVAPAFAARAGDVASIAVTTAEESYRIVRRNGGWIEPGKGGYPVAAGQVADLIHAVAGMTFAAPMTRDDKKFDRIGLGDPNQGGTGALVEIADGKGAVLFRKLVGYRDGRSYVREPGDLQAWAVKAEAMPPLQRGARWLDLEVVSIPASAIREVEVKLVGQPGYRLLPKDASGARFALAPPYDRRQLAAALAPTLPAQALAHFAPVDVAPATSLASARLAAIHVTHSRSGLEARVQAYKLGDRGWVTVSARAETGAAPGVAAKAAAIDARASGWAFALSATDWSAFATPLEAIVEGK